MMPNRKRNAFQQREADQRRMVSNLAGPHQITGQFLLDGSGETTKDLKFPVNFIEKPLFYAGFEMDTSSAPVDGAFPLATATAFNWVIKEPDLDNNALNLRKYFTGVSVAVVCVGSPNQKVWVNWMAVGKAITNPLSGVSDFTTDSAI